MISDVQLLTLCAFQEADGECDEGLAAIPEVALNRTRLKYASDGTITGTILRHDQFSWTEWSMVNETYALVAHNPQQELARVEQLLATDEKSVAQWARCSRIVAAVMAGTFKGPLFDQLTPTTVLYDNIALAQPSWIATVRHVVKIQHHDFFEPMKLAA